MFRREFFNSDHWPFYRYNANRRRRIDLVIEDIEPGSKKSMLPADKFAVQRAITEQLAARNRGPFRGAIALRLAIETTAKTPPHIQSIAKNFLDLLGRSPSAKTRRRADPVLYHDDSQVHALAVSCRHGETVPSVRITAQSHHALIQDLGIASHVQRHLHEKREREAYRPQRLDDAVERFIELVRDEREGRKWPSVELFHQWRALAQRDAQEALFTKTQVDLALLAHLHDSPSPIVLPGHKIPRMPTEDFENLLRSFPMRINLPNLPHKPNESAAYKRIVEEALRSFRSKYALLLTPLRIPAALEVFVKPPLAVSLHTVHDLDNIVRNYLIPAVVFELKPFSSFEFSFRDRKPSAKEATEATSFKRPAPETTRFGVPRYEIWRLPRFVEDASAGFVCLNFVYDPTGFEDSFRRLEKEIEEARASTRHRR